MKRLLERILIQLCKLIDVDLLAHAHVQLGVGHGWNISGEDWVLNTYIKDLLPETPVFFDVGANRGQYVTDILAAYPKATPYCFEPMPDSFAELLANFQPLGVICCNFGLSDKAERTELYQGNNDAEGTMATRYPDALTSILTYSGGIRRKVVCDFRTLDDFCEEKAIEHVDFLKIDTEGHELSVLKGARKMIAENRISIVQFEFNEFNIVSRNFLKDYYDELPAYRFFRIKPNNTLAPLGTYQPVNEIFRYQNIIAVHPSIRIKN